MHRFTLPTKEQSGNAKQRDYGEDRAKENQWKEWEECWKLRIKPLLKNLWVHCNQMEVDGLSFRSRSARRWRKVSLTWTGVHAYGPAVPPGPCQSPSRRDERA